MLIVVRALGFKARCIGRAFRPNFPAVSVLIRTLRPAAIFFCGFYGRYCQKVWIGSPGGLGVSGREEEGLIVNPTSRRSRWAVSEPHPLRVLGASLPPLR
jgi:hypothetical protein